MKKAIMLAVLVVVVASPAMAKGTSASVEDEKQLRLQPANTSLSLVTPCLRDEPTSVAVGGLPLSQLPGTGIGTNYVDQGRVSCTHLNDRIVGAWRKHYVPNYRGWAEIACELAVAVEGSRAIRKIRGSSTSTSATRSGSLREEAIEVAKYAATELGCSVISQQSGWNLIRVWDGTYYRNITVITGHWHPAGYCYARRETITEYK